MRRDVRILLVGDGNHSPGFSARTDHNYSIVEGVGKSTIVTSLIKESFVSQVSQYARNTKCSTEKIAQVQHIVPEVTIPPEVTPENVTTYIVDSGCQSLS